MIWTLNKVIALTTAKIFVATVFSTSDSEAIRQYRMTLNQLSRILKRVQDSQMLHPSLLVSDYGSATDYLRVHLSSDDYRYFHSLRDTTSDYTIATSQQRVADLV